MESIPYAYRLTDKVTGKRYIGSRYAKSCSPDDLGVTYFTSSSIVSKLFKEDPSRFEKQILVTGDRDYVIRVEHSLLELYDAVKSDEFYNRTNGKAIHPDDIARGIAKTNSVKDSEGRSLAAVKGGLRGGANGTFAGRSKAGKLGGAVSGPMNAHILVQYASEGGKKGGVETCKLRMKCAVCGMETNRGNAARHSKSSGHNEWVKL